MQKRASEGVLKYTPDRHASHTQSYYIYYRTHCSQACLYSVLIDLLVLVGCGSVMWVVWVVRGRLANRVPYYNETQMAFDILGN